MTNRGIFPGNCGKLGRFHRKGIFSTGKAKGPEEIRAFSVNF